MRYGRLAGEAGYLERPLEILKSGAGFYIGTTDEKGFPLSRESVEYWPERAEAATALRRGSWQQRSNP